VIFYNDIRGSKQLRYLPLKSGGGGSTSLGGACAGALSSPVMRGSDITQAFHFTLVPEPNELRTVRNS
jgi:hypothetical protein